MHQSLGGPAHVGLVLSGGGARAAYQVGVLAALAERVPSLNFPILTGVSAGAINTLYLAASPGSFADAVTALRGEWARLTADRVYRVRPTRLGRMVVQRLLRAAIGRRAGPTPLRGLLDMEPLREFLAGGLDVSGLKANLATGRLRAVALTATSYSSGHTVTFVQGAPEIPTWERARRLAVRTPLTIEHVLASSAIPVLFPAVQLGEEYYGDGSVRQTAPLSPAIHLGARAVVAIAMQTRLPATALPSAPEYPTAAQALGIVLNSIFLQALDADAERLARINRLLELLPPDVRPPDLGRVELLMLHPSQDLGALAAGRFGTLPRTVRFVVETMGGKRVRAADFLSYLLFEPSYTSRLMDLGHADVNRNWPQIASFFERVGV